MKRHVEEFCTHRMIHCLECSNNMMEKELYGHCTGEGATCLKRNVRCLYDYCGKLIFIDVSASASPFISDFGIISSEPSDAKVHEVSILAVQERLVQWEAYGIECVSTILSSDEQKEYEKNWIGNELHRLRTFLQQHLPIQYTPATILQYNAATGTHLIEYEGRRQWHALKSLRFIEAVEQTARWFCEHLQYQDRVLHMESTCRHRMVSCPLECGQRMSAYQVNTHTKESCNKRLVPCSLCRSIFSLEKLLLHERNECVLRSVECDYCHRSFQTQNGGIHLRKDCTVFPRSCAQGCSVPVAWQDVVSHAKICTKRPVQCKDCFSALFYDTLEKHCREECKERVFGKCPVKKCPVILLYREKEMHLHSECEYREITCTNCDEIMLFHELERHGHIHCDERHVECRLGCQINTLLAKHRSEHEAYHCNRRIVPCVKGCGESISSVDKDHHDEHVCTRRAIKCPLHCSEIIRMCEMDMHVEICDRRMVPCGYGSQHCARPLRAWLTGDVFHGKGRMLMCKPHLDSGLLFAIRGGDIKLVRTFLDRLEMSSLNEEYSNGQSPLSMACSLGNLEMVNVLLAYGANCNSETSRGRTPLREAIRGQNETLVNVLLDAKAQLSSRNKFGHSVMDLVEECITSDSFKTYLHDHEARERTITNLFRAISRGDMDAVETMIAGKFTIIF